MIDSRPAQNAFPLPTKRALPVTKPANPYAVIAFPSPATLFTPFVIYTLLCVDRAPFPAYSYLTVRIKPQHTVGLLNVRSRPFRINRA